MPKQLRQRNNALNGENSKRKAVEKRQKNMRPTDYETPYFGRVSELYT